MAGALDLSGLGEIPALVRGPLRPGPLDSCPVRPQCALSLYAEPFNNTLPFAKGIFLMYGVFSIYYFYLVNIA